MSLYPRSMYHATKPPVTVYTPEQEAKLGPEWSRQYIHQSYPRWNHHFSGKTVLVQNAEEEAALEGGWAATTTAFDAYKNPRTGPTQQADPTRWADGLLAAGLSAGQLQKLKAQLWKADARYWTSPDPPGADVECMRQAFDGIAGVLFDAGMLTADLLKEGIPSLVWDCAISGEWWRLASEVRSRIFSEQLGHYWVYRNESTNWDRLFIAETAQWQARLLEVAAEAVVDSSAVEEASSTMVEEKDRESPPTKKRGRPARFSKDQKQRALSAKAEGGNRAAARTLYGTRYPTPQQVKNVSTILRHFRGT